MQRFISIFLVDRSSQLEKNLCFRLNRWSSSFFILLLLFECVCSIDSIPIQTSSRLQPISVFFSIQGKKRFSLEVTADQIDAYLIRYDR